MKFTDADIGSVEIKIFLLKKGVDSKQQSNRKQRFIGGKSIIFTINGQVHGFYGGTKIKDWGFPYLKDSLLIQIDCTEINTNFRQDLFMANRYNFKETSKLEKLEEEIKKALKSNTKLKEANTNRKNQLLNSPGNYNEFNKVIKDTLSQNPAKEELIKLLKNQGSLFEEKSQKLKSKISDKKRYKEKQFVSSKRFPSIFKVNLTEKNSEKVKGIPKGGKGIIEFETDVQNDYLQRPNEKGELILEILGYNSNSSQHPNPQPSPNKVEDCFNTTITGPDDHSIKITFEPTQQLNVGDKIKFNAKLSSPEGNLEAVFYVKITKQRKDKVKKYHNSSNYNLPTLIKVRKKDDKWIKDDGEEWNEDSWGDDSVVCLLTSGNKVDAIAINISNNILRKYISKKAKNPKSLDVIKNKYFLHIYLHALFLFNSIETNKIKGNTDSAELVSNIFKTYGEASLYLDVNDGILKVIEQKED